MYDKRRVAAVALIAAGATVLLAGYRLESTDAAPAATETVTAPAETRADPTQKDLVPCTAEDVEAKLDPGEVAPAQESWDTTLYVTNVGAAECGLEGTGDIAFYADTGAQIERTRRVAEGDGPADDLVVVAPGGRAEMYIHYGSAPADQASGNCPAPALARVVLPNDSTEIEVSPPEEMAALPPLCGEEFQASPWAPGV
jgi:Protein of unknown function (DUF4232)